MTIAEINRIFQELGDQQIDATIAQQQHETEQRDRVIMEEKMNGD